MTMCIYSIEANAHNCMIQLWYYLVYFTSSKRHYAWVKNIQLSYKQSGFRSREMYNCHVLRCVMTDRSHATLIHGGAVANFTVYSAAALVSHLFKAYGASWKDEGGRWFEIFLHCTSSRAQCWQEQTWVTLIRCNNLMIQAVMLLSKKKGIRQLYYSIISCRNPAQWAEKTPNWHISPA